jgi:uncharacterized protein (TIGR02646 family)
MKHIKKQPEPQSLTAKRNTEGSIYDGPQKDWQEALLEEQGYICAYCMRRIKLKRENGKPLIQIEHYRSREKHPELGLWWANMLGVCNGNYGIQPHLYHCDKSKGKENEQGIFVKGKVIGEVELNVLDPLDIKKSENIVTYSSSGKILPNTQNENLQQSIIEDLDCILNLNDEKLRMQRKQAMDIAKESLEKKYPNPTLLEIEREIEVWKTKKDGKYQPFCQAAIWFLEYLKSKPIHKS